MAQIPLSVAAINMRPRGESVQVYRMGAAIAPRRYLSGVMPRCEAVRSYKRLLELNPASYIERVTECPARRLFLSWFMRHESA
jgi:hypothetical protein